MTKQEFLEKLRLALNGKIESEMITENLRFYQEYINTEIRKGKSEEEVLAALGDPRLIARTIVETKGGNSGHTAGYEYDKPLQEDRQVKHLNFLARIPLWVWLIVVFAIVMLILSVIFSIVSAVAPVLVPILLVLFLVKLIRDRLN